VRGNDHYTEHRALWPDAEFCVTAGDT